MKENKSTYALVILHAIVWFAFIFINYFISHQFYHFVVLVERIGIILLLNLVVYLFCYYFLVPKFINSKKYLAIIVFGLFTFLISYEARLYIEGYFEKFLLLDKTTNITFETIKLLTFIPQGLMVLLGCLLAVLKFNFMKDEQLYHLKIEEANRELELIKAKINPHFLLNTLNNIYAINYEESPKTSEAILQLSTILSYTIYKSKSKLISLQEEIDLMISLIGLYQLKNNHQLNITFDYTDIVDHNTMIPTQILFSLLENSFKHSDISVLNPGSFIKIILSLRDHSLHFEIENSIKENSGNMFNTTNYSSGLGADAIQRLLEDNYKNFDFKVAKSTSSYQVNLVIDEL